MKKTPLVTICIPTYNVENTLKSTLNSIINQSYKNIIIKIVDNCSSDKTIQIAASFKDRRIKIFRYKKKVVAEENFNRCIKLSDGKYTAIYHADDIYDEEIVSKQVCFLEKNMKAGAVFSEGRLIDTDNRIISNMNNPIKIKNDNFNYSFDEILNEIVKNYNFLICPSAMVRTEIYKKQIKRFRHKKFGNSSDLDVWLRIAGNYSIGIIKQKLINYRISPTQQTNLTRKGDRLPEFFKVTELYMKKLNKLKKNNVFEDYLILKSYIYIFLIVASIKNNNKNDEKLLLKKFITHKKKISKLAFTKKKIYVDLIYFALKFTSRLNFIKMIIVNFLYIKFYKV